MNIYKILGKILHCRTDMIHMAARNAAHYFEGRYSDDIAAEIYGQMMEEVCGGIGGRNDVCAVFQDMLIEEHTRYILQARQHIALTLTA